MGVDAEEKKPLSTTCDSGKAKSKPGTRIENLQLGVYRVLVERKTSSIFEIDLKDLYEIVLSRTKLVRRLVAEVVFLAPGLMFLMTLANLWASIENVVLLSLETKILKIIEIGLSDGGANGQALMFAVCSRLLFVICTALISHWSRDLSPSLRKKVTDYYGDFLMTKNLNMDLPTAQANLKDRELSSSVPWEAFDGIFELSVKCFGVITELGFVAHVARSGNHGPIFALLCIGKPVMYLLTRKSLWDMPRIVQTNNEDYVRMQSLRWLEGKNFRMEVITGNIAQYIMNEFNKARGALGDIRTEHPEFIYSRQDSPLPGCISSVFGDLPVLYYAAIAFLAPSSMSLTTIATLQQASTLLRWSFWDIFFHLDNMHALLARVQQLYDLETASVAIKDGHISYPSAQTTSSSEFDKGMAFELRAVTFSYPGSKSSSEKTKALDNVSFRIDPGQLVVIVGANGSGKSTFIKLITRLYDADSGKVLVDGEDVQDYKVAELRQAIATLTQDHHLFPLSIEENIGLGYSEFLDLEEKERMELINEASKRGGAEDVIAKLGKGMKSVLDPYMMQYGVNIDEDGDSELAKELKELDKSTDVSGGERQRIVAARTFMRFNSKKVRFVAVDEPSSALDAEAELNLFNNLREMRQGKTMVFVTHRFGHLTKHADKILCMKDGQVVETGSHAELMAMEGEYHKLYNIQAKAFESDKE
ncbi:hypothetical protein D9758_012974 [Tetrapyrgos nigripes]|uniref:ABC transporter domain-containing protein n=1 Tax=Tetrapyrgos nigripes TaxID=182062 RepID=A0A8H5FNR9_9AGAR|nr:hypothetical protein D9758_012974 [Tetrapyrgos nigripes]